MKTKIINFKAKPEDHERWRAALDKQGKTLTEIVTAALNRFATKVEREAEDE